MRAKRSKTFRLSESAWQILEQATGRSDGELTQTAYVEHVLGMHEQQWRAALLRLRALGWSDDELRHACESLRRGDPHQTARELAYGSIPNGLSAARWVSLIYLAPEVPECLAALVLEYQIGNSRLRTSLAQRFEEIV